MMRDIFISVIITAYNRKDFLLDAIKSALNQTLDKKYYEIIVIKNFNDEIIDTFIENNNIIQILMDGTIGKFLYAGINESHGQIISFLDDDDLFFNNKLEDVYNLFKNNNIVYYHNLLEYINENKISINKRNYNISFNLSSISIKKDIINMDALKEISIDQDIFMYLCALESNGKIIRGKETLTYYRFHNSVSNYVENNDFKLTHKTELFKNAVSNVYNIYNKFHNNKVKLFLFNQIITLKLELNILYKIGYCKSNYKIDKNEILKYLYIFQYGDSKKLYYIKLLKLFELFMPNSIIKNIELFYT